MCADGSRGAHAQCGAGWLVPKGRRHTRRPGLQGGRLPDVLVVLLLGLVLVVVVEGRRDEDHLLVIHLLSILGRVDHDVALFRLEGRLLGEPLLCIGAAHSSRPRLQSL